jgi:phenylalanyl-tRNA synthetase beta chain
MVLHGETTAEWHTPSRELDLFDLKGCVEALFVALGIEKATWRHHAEDGFHPGRSAEVVIDEKRLGVAGELSPALAEHFGLSGRTAVAELSVEALMEAPSPRSGVAAPKRFPPVLLDLAVVVSVETPASEVLEVARANGGELLEDVRLFDHYLGEQLDEGKKSLAMSLSFRADDRTLTESEAMDGLQKVKSALADRFGAEERS